MVMMFKPLIAQLANVWRVQTTILDGGAMAFVMMATTMKVATGMVEIVAWDLLKTTIGALSVLAWTLILLTIPPLLHLQHVDLPNGRVMDSVMMTTIMMHAILMEVDSWYLYFS